MTASWLWTALNKTKKKAEEEKRKKKINICHLSFSINSQGHLDFLHLILATCMKGCLAIFRWFRKFYYLISSAALRKCRSILLLLLFYFWITQMFGRYPVPFPWLSRFRFYRKIFTCSKKFSWIPKEFSVAWNILNLRDLILVFQERLFCLILYASSVYVI